jgi:hypothetical protein
MVPQTTTEMTRREKAIDDLFNASHRDEFNKQLNEFLQQDAQQRYEKAMEFLDLDIAELENINGLQLMTTTFGNMKTALRIAAGGKE